MKFADQDGVFREATAEDLLKMAGVTPPASSDERSVCASCGEPCDFGDRGDGPAQQHIDTGASYCSLKCLARESEHSLADRFDAMEAQQEEAAERLNDYRYETDDIKGVK